RELALVVGDRLDADRGDVVHRRAEADHLGDWHRAGLELVRQLAPGRLLGAYRADHVAAQVEGRHRLEQLGAAPERPDPARPAELVRAESEEVAPELLHGRAG